MHVNVCMCLCVCGVAGREDRWGCFFEGELGGTPQTKKQAEFLITGDQKPTEDLVLCGYILIFFSIFSLHSQVLTLAERGGGWVV